MKKKVLKWNFSVLDTTTQTIVYSIDYNFNHDDYMLAFREMMQHIQNENPYRYIRKLKKVVRIERVDAPGTKQIKRLIRMIQNRNM